MREILFRGKRTSNGEWEYGDLWRHPYGKPDICIANPINDDGCMGGRTVDPETVGQFTGLTDKNGKRIFEGDIPKVQTQDFAEEDNPVFGKMKVPTGEKRTRYWTVEWADHFCGGSGWYFYGKDRRFNRRASKSAMLKRDAEVVGNIYDDPELMLEVDA